MTDEARRILYELHLCANTNCCAECRHRDYAAKGISCVTYLKRNAIEIIERLIEKNDELTKELAAAKSGWISVEDRLPEEHDSAFAKLYSTSKWSDAMFRKQSNRVIAAYRCSNGAYIVRDGNTCDGIWGVERDLRLIAPGRVTHWQPLPEPPKEVFNELQCSKNESP